MKRNKKTAGLVIVFAVALVIVFAATAFPVQTSKTLNYFGVTVKLGDDVELQLGDGADVVFKFDDALTGRATMDFTAPAGGVNVLSGNAFIGNATPTQTLNGEDLYVEGFVEIDGMSYLDGGWTVPADITLTLGTATLGFDTADSVVVATGSWDFSDLALVDTGGGLFFDDDVMSTWGDGDDATTGFNSANNALETTATNITLIGAVGVTGAVVATGAITSSATGTLGWHLVTGANTACTTTCTSACVHGQDADAANVLVECDDAAADLCVCAGAS